MQTVYNERIDEKVLFQELESGLKVYYMPKPGFQKKYAIFSTNYGSIDNKFIPIGEDDAITAPEGIAHFLEHKLFESEDSSTFDKFSKMGAYVNAYTSFNQTSYLFYTTDNFYESLDLLVKFVQSPYLTEENVEKEKGIISQEIMMYNDNPKWKVFFNCLKGMYVNHPVKIDIGGTVESINTITKELLYKAYNTFYHPTNMVLFIAGDLSFEEILNTVKNAEKTYPKLGDYQTSLFENEPTNINQSYIEEKMMVSTPLLYIGIKDNYLKLQGEESIRKNIITNMILDMLFSPSSEFYNELYNEGLIDSSFGAYFTGKKTYGHSLIMGQSIKPEEVYKKVKELLKKPINSLLKEEDFHRLKKKNLGGFLMGLNSLDFIASNFVELYFDGFNILDYLSTLEKINLEDLSLRFKEHFIEENMVLSVIRPI